MSLHYSQWLSHLLMVPSQSQIALAVLKGLLSDLRSVEVGKGATVVRLKHYKDCVPEQHIATGDACQHCTIENGRHRIDCPNSAESMLQSVRELINTVPSPEGKVALGWVVQAASTFEKIRDLPGWNRQDASVG